MNILDCKTFTDYFNYFKFVYEDNLRSPLIGQSMMQEGVRHGKDLARFAIYELMQSDERIIHYVNEAYREWAEYYGYDPVNVRMDAR